MKRQQTLQSMFSRKVASASVASKGNSSSSSSSSYAQMQMLHKSNEKPSLFEQLKHKLAAPPVESQSSPDIPAIKTPSDKRERPSFSLGTFFGDDDADKDNDDFPSASQHTVSLNRTPASEASKGQNGKRKFEASVYNGGFEDRLNSLQNDASVELSGPVTPALRRYASNANETHKAELSIIGGADSQGLSKRRKFLDALFEGGSQKGADAEKAKSRFDFLDPSVILDAQRRRPSHPQYDKRTLHIPKETLNKMSASQRQYWETKSQYMDIVLFFKVGKFYELYELDAEIGQKEFDWKMTVSGVGKCKQVGVPEAGIDDAIQKLLTRGYKVGRMEQVETAEEAKARKGSGSTLKRKLVQVLTPSTAVDENLKMDAVHLLSLKEKEVVQDNDIAVAFGFAFVDAAVCKFFVGTLSDDSLRSSLGALLMQVSPRELLYETQGLSMETLKAVKKYSRLGCSTLELTALQRGLDFIDSSMVKNLIHSNGFFKGSTETPWSDAIDRTTHNELSLSALGGLVTHLQRMKLDDDLLRHGTICTYEVYKGSLKLDGQTISNLEIFHNNDDGGQEGTLFRFLDHCSTAFGKRLLRCWICHPLQNATDINARLDAVEELLSRPEIACAISEKLRKLPDLERLVARVKASNGSSFAVLGPLLGQKKFKQRVKALTASVSGLRGGVQILNILQTGEQGPPKSRLLFQASSIEFLKDIDELLDQMDQTIKTGSLLNEKGSKQVLGLDNKEVQAFLSVAEIFHQYAHEWSRVVDSIALVDVLIAFAISANSSIGARCRPIFVPAQIENNPLRGRKEASVLSMQGLWHPYAVKGDERVPVPNDLHLGKDGSLECPRAILLTGPNMGGKSTMLRATCLVVIMAQLGCYVPCEECVLSPVDIIFTRLGATDHIMSGESTFLVECMEAAAMLRYATQNSLVVLDELGRGTSTFDGYAIAYAVLRHLVETKDCRLLFSTHYHPLTKEFALHPRVSLKHMACSFNRKLLSGRENNHALPTREAVASKNDCPNEHTISDDTQLTFLYKLSSGASPESYGLQVALLAGMPRAVVESAVDASKAMKSCLSTSFKSSELRAQFSSMHEQWLSTILSTTNIKQNCKGPECSIEDTFDTLICIWHEMQNQS